MVRVEFGSGPSRFAGILVSGGQESARTRREPRRNYPGLGHFRCEGLSIALDGNPLRKAGALVDLRCSLRSRRFSREPAGPCPQLTRPSCPYTTASD
jgi:hypothetical protein